MILRPEAGFELALRLKQNGVPLGQLFAFLSGLYFRGKLVYATTFADPPPFCPGVFVITPCCGLMHHEALVTADDLRLFAATDIHKDVAAYTLPFSQDARKITGRIQQETDVILLGSVATDKYLKVLLDSFGHRLKFPIEFTGRGDMSRGGLLLRHASDRQELEYIRVEGANLRGKKPPRLQPRPYRKRNDPDDKGPA